jgi:nucleotide-binding universal stress UspA family protein
MSTTKILVAVEDEHFAKEITDFVIHHEWPADVSFRVVHIVEEPPPIPLPASYHELTEAYWDVGTRLVRESSAKIKNAFPNASVLDQVIEGDPKEEIVRAAEVWGANMIVLGARGRHGFRRFLLGSVTRSVSVHAPCSVMIVRPFAAVEKVDEQAAEAATAGNA